jgi:WD40 repeat protein
MHPTRAPFTVCRLAIAAFTLLPAGAGLPAQAPVPVDRDAALYRAQLNAAEYALRLGEAPVAREWLDATEPARRGIEWRLRDGSSDDSLASHPFGAGRGNALACSPDGALVAIGTNRGELELRATVDGAVVRRVAAHSESISQVRFDRRGERLVTASHDRKVRVFAVADLRLLAEFGGHGFPVGGADFSADGTLVVSCSYERPPNTVVGTVHVWNAADGTLVRTMTGGRKPLVQLAVAPDGQHVAAASWDFCLFVWPLGGGEPRKLAVPDEGIYNGVDGVAWSPCGKWLALASKDKTARVFTAATGELVASLRGHRDAVGRLQFSPDGALLATASNDGTVRLWSTATWQHTAELRGHRDDVFDLGFQPDGRRLFTIAKDATLRVWDPACPWYGPSPMRATRAAYVCRWSPDGHRLATCSYDGRVQVWCADTQELLGSFAAHAPDKSCHMLEWTLDGAGLQTGSYDGTIRRFDAITFAEQARFAQQEGFYWLRRSPDGRWVAAAAGKVVLVLDGTTLQLVHTFAGHTAGVQTVSFDPQSQRCVSCARDGKALLFEAATGAPLASIEAASKDVAEACFTPDGRQVVVGERGGLVRLHDAGTGALLRTIVQNRNGFDHLELSPDGQRLVLASAAVTFVDVAHGGVLARFEPHTDHPYHVAFDPRGERLASCSTDQSVVILDPRPLRERLQVRDAALAARARAAAAVGARLAAGETVAGIAAAVAADGAMAAGEKAAFRAALTMRSGLVAPAVK